MKLRIRTSEPRRMWLDDKPVTFATLSDGFKVEWPDGLHAPAVVTLRIVAEVEICDDAIGDDELAVLTTERVAVADGQPFDPSGTVGA